MYMEKKKNFFFHWIGHLEIMCIYDHDYNEDQTTFVY